MTDSQSPNLSEELKQQLQALVPEAFRDDQLDVETLKRLFGSESVFRYEGYDLNWLGKSYARLLANETISTWLKADYAHNSKPENTNSQNLLIKGDNLEVLKHLVGAYSEQVKMIYIDPPYNTGSDGFVYEDDRKFTVEQLSSLAGIDEDEAKRILEFTQAKSNSHSAWLTFMYPRLYIAKHLLNDNGVIFISIDDNEQAQLKMLCDEVFGEENFFATLVRRAMHTVRNTSKDFNKHADYVLAYAKDKSWFESNPANFIRQIVDKTGNYSLDDSDGKGKYKLDPLYARNYATPYSYTFKNGASWQAPVGSFPRYAIETLKNMEEQNKIVLSGNEPKAKRHLRDVQEGQPPNTILSPEDVGFNSNGTSDLHDVLGVDKVFSQPKPIKLIIHLMSLLRDKNAVILDFFAGSGTTAHAVMQLNAEDDANRQFIAIQIPEPTFKIDEKTGIEVPKKGSEEAFKAGYKTIFDITKGRIEKAAAKIKAKNLEYTGDLGFKIFETVAMPDKYQDAPYDLTENLELFDANKLSQAELHNLMRTWALQDNVALTQDLVKVDLAGYTAYQAKHLLYFIEPNITLDTVIKMLEQLDTNPDFKPSRIVVFGYLLESKIQREMTEAVRQYNNRKGIELTLDIRY